MDIVVPLPKTNTVQGTSTDNKRSSFSTKNSLTFSPNRREGAVDEARENRVQCAMPRF
jgi:hypothetical protein